MKRSGPTHRHVNTKPRLPSIDWASHSPELDPQNPAATRSPTPCIECTFAVRDGLTGDALARAKIVVLAEAGGNRRSKAQTKMTPAQLRTGVRFRYRCGYGSKFRYRWRQTEVDRWIGKWVGR